MASHASPQPVLTLALPIGLTRGWGGEQCRRPGGKRKGLGLIFMAGASFEPGKDGHVTVFACGFSGFCLLSSFLSAEKWKENGS